jgi:hypothetical protein
MLYKKVMQPFFLLINVKLLLHLRSTLTPIITNEKSFCNGCYSLIYYDLVF